LQEPNEAEIAVGEEFNMRPVGRSSGLARNPWLTRTTKLLDGNAVLESLGFLASSPAEADAVREAILALKSSFVQLFLTVRGKELPGLILIDIISMMAYSIHYIRRSYKTAYSQIASILTFKTALL
jgi:hypothetical protein